jgi:hypothetical protein
MTKPSGPTPTCTGKAPCPDLAFRKFTTKVATMSNVRNLVTANGSSRERVGAKPDHSGSTSRGFNFHKSNSAVSSAFAPFLLVGAASSCHVTHNVNVSDGETLLPTSIVIHSTTYKKVFKDSGPALRHQLPHTSYT